MPGPQGPWTRTVSVFVVLVGAEDGTEFTEANLVEAVCCLMCLGIKAGGRLSPEGSRGLPSEVLAGSGPGFLSPSLWARGALVLRPDFEAPRAEGGRKADRSSWEGAQDGMGKERR